MQYSNLTEDPKSEYIRITHNSVIKIILTSFFISKKHEQIFNKERHTNIERSAAGTFYGQGMPTAHSLKDTYIFFVTSKSV